MTRLLAPPFLALSGCAPCPTFDEIAVTITTTEMDTDDAAAEVNAAIARFAEWTGREGVCVEEIAVADEVTIAGPDGPVVVDGVYRSMARRIDVNAPSNMGLTVVHELCHALDAREHLSMDNAHLFDGDTIEEREVDRTKAKRIQEAFAMACQEGPEASVVQEAVSEACGVDLVGDQARFFRDVVFPGFEQAGEVEPGEPVDALEWRTGADRPLIAGVEMLDIRGDDTGLALLLRRISYGTVRLELFHYDVATGAFLASRRLTLPDDIDVLDANAALVPTDTGLVWVLVDGERDLLVHPDEGVVRELDEHVIPVAGAVSEGVFYGATGVTSPTLSAWHLATGARLDLPAEGRPDPLGYIEDVFPMPGGVGLRGGRTVARLAAGRWITAPELDGLSGPPILRDGAPVFLVRAGVGRQPVRLDADWMTWTVDPVCGEAPAATARLVTVTGEPLVVDVGTSEIRVADLPD